MKNIQIIDSAANCSYSVYEIPNNVFEQLFPLAGQDVEFIDDVEERLGKRKTNALIKFTWHSQLSKQHVRGIHGTLFFEMPNRKAFYPNKRESDLDDPEIQKRVRGIPK